MKTRIAALTAVLLLALTGCAGVSDATESEPQGPEESAAPLVAQTPSATPSSENSKTVDEAGYIKEVRELLPEATAIPDATDEQLIATGLEACELKSAGEDLQAISLIEGEQQGEGRLYVDSWAIVRAALNHLC